MTDVANFAAIITDRISRRCLGSSTTRTIRSNSTRKTRRINEIVRSIFQSHSTKTRVYSLAGRKRANILSFRIKFRSNEKNVIISFRDFPRDFIRCVLHSSRRRPLSTPKVKRTRRSEDDVGKYVRRCTYPRFVFERERI